MTIHELLQEYWQYPEFRPLQETIINSVLDGQDTLALLPTGGGKSLCFQIPALAKEGICIVVTPLIALMKDQVENLRSRDIEAIAVFSGMSKREIDIALDNCIYGKTKFLYLSPERLLSELVRERIRYMNVNLFAVDEAHCISHWGYDFRPAYLHVASLRELHPEVPFIALTAAAIARVVVDIQEKLLFKPAKSRFYKKSFFRRNLAYMALYEENKMGRLLKVINKVKGSGIIYVRNRRETQEVARFLTLNSINADFYHAGLNAQDRSKKQEAWKSNKTPVIVATNAFGMGIDKPDVRFVIHIDLPDSLEAYYQEAGRAGRDDEKAYAVLLYHEADRIKLKTNFELSFPTAKEIAQVYFHLGNYYQLAYGAGQFLTLDFDLADFCSRYQLHPKTTIHALKFLEHDEWISLSENTYLPSRLQFDINASELYHFQVENISLDPLIKTILRAYGSAFDHFVEVDENDIAKKMGVSYPSVVKELQKLHELEVLSYLPQTDKPQIQFLQPRIDTTNLQIDHTYIRERKEIMQMQMESVFAYLKGEGCRSKALLAYFDELESKDCGICDHCLKLKAKRKNIDKTIQNEILKILAERARSLEELIDEISLGEEKIKIKSLRKLLDLGKVKKDKDYYSLN
jgi:ATP-dependent DNA helicase RecQ